ncbi:aldehyde dehydrogenase [Georgenia yuyongxinii]|uniref:Aldehyde dehydrogenase n=2 Tax=Georgenia yuyongxinii TaxID=2589797 RepID=A0A5B8CAR9_9MICO|nr:aldehyde dehydrogenase [Georgenia yuyongxinii]
MTMMQGCMEACSAAAMAATMCADADSGENMGRCASMCMNTADVATATMRMMMRTGGYDMKVMSSMMTACMVMGEACAAECGSHAEMSEHCRICASACRAMVEACSKMMSGMKG